MKKSLLSVLMIGLLMFGMGGSVAAYEYFTDSNQWEEYNPGTGGFVGQGFNAKGMWGALFADGYMYFSGGFEGSNAYDDEFMRFDVSGNFSTQGDWEIYDPGANGVGDDNADYRGIGYDGRYVYFAPYGDEAAGFRSSIVKRYDTQGDFDSSSSWTAYDLAAINSSFRGFIGVVYDGRYMYFVPTSNAIGNVYLVRYDTQGTFNSSGSWESYNLGSSNAYVGGTFDGRYVYLGPAHDAGNAVRYDTQGTFTSSGSYETYSLGGLYYWPVADENYVYYAPLASSGSNYFGEVVRYDRSGDFESGSSWETFDVEAAGVGTDPTGYYTSFYDGRNVYYGPLQYGAVGNHQEILKYDTTGNFDSANSYSTMDLIAESVVTTDVAMHTGEIGWDGQRFYFVPFAEGNDAYGTFVQYDSNVDTMALRPRVTLSDDGVSATNVQLTLVVRPLQVWENGDTLQLQFPDEYDTAFDSLTDSDVSVSGTNIDSTTYDFDNTENILTITFATTSGYDVVSDVTITIGDGAAGGLNDLTNPDTQGSYMIRLIAEEADGSVLAEAGAFMDVTTDISVDLVITEAIILTLTSGTDLVFKVDPAVNNGVDNSQYTELNVASNAGGGYKIYAHLDDGDGVAQIKNTAGDGIASGTGENNIGYEARNAVFDGGESVDADAVFTASPSLLNSNSLDIGYTTTTNSQDHTIYYDLDVDFLTSPGEYGGTVYYTVVPAF